MSSSTSSVRMRASVSLPVGLVRGRSDLSRLRHPGQFARELWPDSASSANAANAYATQISAGVDMGELAGV